MNRIHRLVWNSARAAWQVVSEASAASGKDARGGAVRRAFRAASGWAVLAAACYGPTAIAGPLGGQVVLGGGSVVQVGATTTITQTTPRLAIDWQGFQVGADETVRFVQPGAQSVALNRVLGSDPSRVVGQLSANGQVFLLNPNGVLFGSSARVDVGGLVASTLALSNDDFAAGRLLLQGRASAGVSNAGRITAADGGYVVLAAPQVHNTGDITTRLGTTALVAGEHVTLQLQGGSLLGYRIERGALDALVGQAGRISADGGAVLIEAKALDALSSAVVNHSGISQARTVQAQGGRVVLLGDMTVGQTLVAGTLDASAPEGGDGGFIETSAAVVKVADNAQITTRSRDGVNGTWLVDPTDFTVAATGGDISGTALSAALANGNVTLDSTRGAQQGTGHLYVRDTVNWSDNQLNLRAESDIHLHSDLLGTGNARLALEFGLASANGTGSDYHLHNASRVDLPEGRNFFTRQGSQGELFAYQVITRMTSNGVPGSVSYQEINNDAAGRYALGGSLVADANSPEAPLGGLTGSFTGQFHGLGHTITGLSLAFTEWDPNWNGSNTDVGLGMFSRLAAGSVARDFGLLGGTMSLTLMSRNNYTGSVGSVAGENHGLIHNVYSTAEVKGDTVQSYGGLVGDNGGVLRRSYFGGSGSVDIRDTNSEDAGGMVGFNFGLIEDTFSISSINNSSFTALSAVGRNHSMGRVNRVYAIDPNQVIDNNITRDLDLAAMQTASSFVGWDIGTDADGDSIWRIVEGQSTPLLRDLRRRVNMESRLTYNGAVQVDRTATGRNVGFYAAGPDVSPLGAELTGGLTIDPVAITVSSTDVSRVYDGTTTAMGAEAVVTAGAVFGTDRLGPGRFAFADRHAGTGKTVQVSDVSVRDGNGGANYILTLVDNTGSTITPAPFRIEADPITKVYDGTTVADASWRPSAGRLFGSDSLGSVQFSFDNAQVGNGKPLVLDSAVINDGNGGANYTLTLANNARSSIVPAELVVTAANDQRVAGGAPYLGGNGFTTRGWVAGEDDAWLQGVVAYGGSAQGAVSEGSYGIVPGGLLSPNYRLVFEPGVLVISALPAAVTPPVVPPPEAPVPEAPVPVAPVPVALPEAPVPASLPSFRSAQADPAVPQLPIVSRLPDDAARGSAEGTGAAHAIALLACGMRLPAELQGDDCD